MYWREKLAIHAWHKGAQRIFEIVNRGRFPVRVGTQKSTCTSAGKNPTFELLSQYIIHAASESIFTYLHMEQETWMEDCLARLDFSDIADMSQIPNTFCVKATLRRCWTCMEEPPFALGYELAIRRALREFLQIDKPKVEKTHTDLEAKMSMAFFCWHGWRHFWISKGGSPFFLGDFRQNQQMEFQLGVYCALFFLLSAPQFHGSDGYQDELQPGERRAITARMLFVGPIFWFWRGRTEKIWKDMVDVVMSSTYPCGN